MATTYPRIYLHTTFAQSQPSIIVWLHPLNLCSIKYDVFITKADTQTNTFSRMFICEHAPITIHLLVHIVATFICKTSTFSSGWILPVQNSCYFLQKHFICHTNTEVTFMFKWTNDRTITGNIYEITVVCNLKGLCKTRLIDGLPIIAHPMVPLSHFTVHL